MTWPVPMFDPARVGEHIHGHIAWLAVAALVHPAILLRHTRRRAHMAVGFAVALVTCASALGIALYPAYRAALRQPIFARSATVGYLFERKEHLAFGVLILSWTGAVTYAAAAFAEVAVREPLRRAAHWAFTAAAVLAAVTAALGTAVAAFQSF
jgi:hypothetical protein